MTLTTSLLVGLCLVATFLPLVPKAHGIFRVFEFPRLQIATIVAMLFIVSALLLPNNQTTWILIGTTTTILLVQCWYIVRFSPLWRRRSAEYTGKKSNVPIVRLLVSNVKQSNREYSRLIELVEKVDPDIVLFMETDQDWVNALQEATTRYPHQVEHALDNSYGMLLVSKLRLYDFKVRFLLNPDVPSIDTMVDHHDGPNFRLFAVHPEPPLVHKDTLGRDAEIAFVGKMTRHDDSPVIVTGDLNDVAWSRTTRRFLRLSRLLDPREGRGLFNTFDARYFFMRWPLDHIFHSPHFQLVSMTRMPFINSDHFPMFYELALTQYEIGRREVDAADPSDLSEATELISLEADRDRRPVGHDWEKD